FAPSKVDTFVGVGCPGAFIGTSRYIEKSLSKGTISINELRQEGKKHVTTKEHSKTIDPLLSVFMGDGDQKISLNLLEFYNNLAIFSNDSQPGNGLSLDNFFLIGGSDGVFEAGTQNGHDTIVPLDDMTQISAQVTANEKTISSFNVRHDELASLSKVKDEVTVKIR
ncbi:MAG: hypothetical protein O2779_05225, partial [Nanoarchaeota archaeon]|nr:hypothetical protein [Nanoarchaeota archaeon]